MIEFEENVNELLPYDREHYIDFLDDDFNSFTEWNAVSLQLDNKRKNVNLTEYVAVFEPVFKNVIKKLDMGSVWVINHDDKDLYWFPNKENNLTSLRKLFKQKKVPNKYRGAIIFVKDDLLELAKDLLSYPVALFGKDGFLYKNLDISHGKLKFIIKITGHLTLDLLSMDKELLKKIINENSSDDFHIIEYRGTSLSA